MNDFFYLVLKTVIYKLFSEMKNIFFCGKIKIILMLIHKKAEENYKQNV
jgi:hypothetical protein